MTMSQEHEERELIPGEDRRNSPRLEVLHRIHGKLRALDIPVRLLNLSYGGFLMEGPLEFTLGGTHDFRFTMPRKTPVVLLARVIHISRRMDTPAPTYVAGLEFEDQDDAAVSAAIESLVSRLYE
jgi:PilZ domain